MEDWDLKRDVMQRYDATAHIYTMRYAEEQTAKIEVALDRTRIEEENVILDAGCGTGLLYDHITHRGETTVGLDISKRILLQAKKRTKKMRNAHLILADVDNIPIKDKIFSHVFAITLLQNVPNPNKTLLEIKRVAKEDAFLIITGLKKKFSLEVFKSLLKANDLEIATLTSNNLQCHVAICTKMVVQGSELSKLNHK